MNGSVTPVVVTVCVYLDHKWKTFDSLLWGEISAQTVQRNENLEEKKTQDAFTNKLDKTCISELGKGQVRPGNHVLLSYDKRAKGGFSTKLLSYKGNVLAEFKTRNVWN